MTSNHERYLSDVIVSGARAAWYSATEPLRLRLARNRNQVKLRGGVVPFSAVLVEARPLVTVYIPTHNRVGLLLDRALPSVLNQTYTNLEIIVAAHGCTDDTSRAVFSAAARDCYERHGNVFNPKPEIVFSVGPVGNPVESRIRLVTVPRRRTYPPTAENHWLAGPVAPANAALRAARGAWIARIDDDDTWTEDHIERLLRFAQEGDYEFVSSAYEEERDGVRKVVRYFDTDLDEPPPRIGGTQTWLYRSYLKFMRYNPDCWRKKWNRVNDTDLADRFWKAGVRIGWLDEVTAYVLPRPGETTVGLDAYRRDAKAKEAHFAF